MSDQAKGFIIAKLREEFVAFMQKMMAMPGSPMQKQQAFLRFDEGHMWMQNAVGSYVATKPVNDAANQQLLEPVPEGEVQPQDGQVIEPEGQPLVSPAE